MSLYGINKDLEEYKTKSNITQPERLNFRVLNNFIEKYSEKMCLINKKDKLAEAFASRNLANDSKLFKEDEKPISFHNCIDFAQFQSLKDYYQSLGMAPSKVFKNFRPTSIQKEMKHVGSRYMQSYEKNKTQNRRKTPPRRHEPDDEDLEMIRMVKDIKLDIQKRSEKKQHSLQKILGIPRGASQPRASILINHHTYGSSKAVTLNTNRSENCKKAFQISKECKKFIASNRLHQREFECIKGGTRENFKEMHKAMDSTQTLHRKQIIDRVQKVLNRLKEAKIPD